MLPCPNRVFFALPICFSWASCELDDQELDDQIITNANYNGPMSMSTHWLLQPCAKQEAHDDR